MILNHPIDNPFLDIQCPKCKDGTSGSIFIEIFSNEHITQANEANKMLPKYGFHCSALCPRCGKFIAHLKQTPDLIGKKFMLIPE